MEIDDGLGRRGTSREIGMLVSRPFESEPAAMKRSVEAQLVKVASLSWAEEEETERGARSRTGICAVRSGSTDVPVARWKRRAALAGVRSSSRRCVPDFSPPLCRERPNDDRARARAETAPRQGAR
ncbi:hypothetical protein [Sorangium sp. So ce1078]|uniref:hypothetical protein n=1 Tax=Sorangium sp. So ce1078 TaxID=3133329 RepID=UPI003F5F6EC5